MKLFSLFLINVVMVFATPLIERTQIHMATFVKVALPQDKSYLFKEAFSLASKLDYTFSTYNPQALAFKLNQNHSINVNYDFLTLLQRSKEIYKLTSGYFSIAVGSLTKKLYHFGEEDQRIPTEIERLKAKSNLLGFHVDGDKVFLDEDVM